MEGLAAMDDLSDEERDCLSTNIAWLERTDPDDWHRVALDFNWSEPLYLLDWIVRRAECDVATALTIFWKGEPGYWIADESRLADKPNGFSYLNKHMCAYIATRISEGGYSRSKIAYAPDTWTKKDYVDLAARAAQLEKPKFGVHPDLIRDRTGYPVTNDAAFYARYPDAFHHSFFCELPAETPKARALMDRVQQIEKATSRLLPSWLRR